MSPAPAGPKADVCVLISVKEGTTVKEYLDLFWSHANSKTIKAKGKSYTLPAPRSGFCDEKKTRVFVNTKAPTQLMLMVFGVDLEIMGTMMGGPEFKEMGEVMWDMTGMCFPVDPPPPPGA